MTSFQVYGKLVTIDQGGKGWDRQLGAGYLTNLTVG
jgi:hypothetical protein